MPNEQLKLARQRAEVSFKRRERQMADAPIAMQEYRAAQNAVLDRMQRLR